MWPLLCLALLSLARADTSCHVEAAGGGTGYLGFLAQRSGAPVLVQSAWDGGGRLLACSVRGDPWLVRRWRAACAKQSPGGPFAPARGPARQRALAALRACSGAERRAAGSHRARRAADAREPAGRRRSRRGWTVPGTLWCGAGDSAGSGAELGIFQGPDLCCREHDQCTKQLAALEYNYGIRNYRLHTVSHCDCDARFKQCLLDLNDTISNIIGVTFFNLLEMPCFVLEESEECVEWYWWGGCKHHGPVALARLVQQSTYDYSPSVGETASPAPPSPGKGQKHSRPGRKHRRKKIKGPRQDKGIQGSQSSREAQKPGTTPPPGALSMLPLVPTVGMGGQVPPLLTASASLEQGPMLGAVHTPTGGAGTEGAGQLQNRDLARLTNSTEQGAMPTPASELRSTPTPHRQAPARSCGCYRRLDQCEYKIAPHKVKYQLHNLDSRTLFHCNCTRRLARFLRRTKGPNEVEEEVLSDFISTACFVLEPPADCANGEEQQPDCSSVGRAILVPARHLKNTLARWRERPVVPIKVKRQEWEAQDSPLSLYDKCLHLARAARKSARHSGPP